MWPPCSPTRHFDPSSLILEITESAMMRDTEVAAQNLGALKRSGLRIALDDFGTGYSSLAYLEQLPIDILKIDRSFVDALSEDDQAGWPRPSSASPRPWATATIAEGVESAAQVERLRQLGCRLAPGVPPRQCPWTPGTEEMLRRQAPRPAEASTGSGP